MAVILLLGQVDQIPVFKIPFFGLHNQELFLAGKKSVSHSEMKHL